jgi:hypothetical protein
MVFTVALWLHYIHLPHPAMPEYYEQYKDVDPVFISIGENKTRGNAFCLSAHAPMCIHMHAHCTLTGFSFLVFLCFKQDYVGTLAQLDASIGRLRQMLVTYGVANNTMLLFTSGQD